jgi:S-formylglutathione hydrolase FrmB
MPARQWSGGAVLDWSLVSGAMSVWTATIGALSLLALTMGSGSRWWTRRVPSILLGAAAMAVIVKVVVDGLWRPFPDALPWTVLLWVGVAGLGIGLSVVRPRSRNAVTDRGGRRRRWWRRVGAVIAGLLVVVASAAQVNRYYGQYPTPRSALGLHYPNEVAFERLPGSGAPEGTAAAERPLWQQWRPPLGMPAGGSITAAPIPAPVSGFPARSGWVYLPPAYLASPRAPLPVLVLLAGQPGTTRDWLDGGRLSQVMDRFATSHDGLAPVVVMPDNLGASLANPLCMDSRLGRVETYLSVDVPAWIRTHLQVNTDPRAWAIAGFSQGGTCALQLAVRTPWVYPTFLDISGQDEPTLGTRTRTVDAAFRGDAPAFARVNPLVLLATNRYAASAGTIVVGREDRVYRAQQQHVFAACRAAGMDVRFLELPGGHTWHVWAPGLERSLPWLGARLGLTAP